MKTFNDIKKIIYCESEISSPIVQRALKRTGLSDENIASFRNEENLGEIIENLKASFLSKEILVLKRFEGRKFQKCPGSPQMICCNYYLLNTCFNCFYNCTYCFLNSYLNSYGIIQFTNLEELVPSIRSFAETNNKILRVGTGEYTDSLMYDDITGIAEMLINGTSELENVFMEFKTKSNKVDHLLDIEKKGNTVLAWTLNTPKNIELYEEDTSSLEDRLTAARKAQDSGFLIALHFDPIIAYEDFLDDYYSVVEKIFEYLNPESIVWISLGCFRYSPGFKDIIKHQFPDEKLTKGELFPSIDGKYKYLKQERINIFKSMKDKIKSFTDKPYIYLCMEDSQIWKDVFGYEFSVSEDLEQHMGDYLKNKFLQ